LLASGVGLAVALAVTAAVNAAGVTYKAGLLSEPIALRIALDPPNWAFTAAFLAAVAVAAALLPARRAARAGIPDALAHA
jgi:putative ABC transport system permease protein